MMLYIYLYLFIPAATGIDPFTPLAADKKGSNVLVKGSSQRPGSPMGKNTSPQ